MAGAGSHLFLGQVLQSSSTRYMIIDFIGEGSFGKVAKCQVNYTSEIVAIKLIKNDYVNDVEQEIAMLSKINKSDPDQSNFVKFYEWFEHSTYICLVFELLETSLLEYLKDELGSSMFVNQIRPIAKQMLGALQSLQTLKIIHSDIKPDNVMLVNTEAEAFQVKLIDFGLALPTSSIVHGKLLQPNGYRAPEVCLGLPYTESIDMWGLGCTLANLYLMANLFPVNCKYQSMKAMVDYLGMPSEDQLLFGRHSNKFFCQEENELGSTWRLLTPQEYSDVNGVKVKEWPKWRPHFTSLDDLLYIFQEQDAEEFIDRKAFIDLLKHLLTMDENTRFSPSEALQHPFLTMSHLDQDPHSDYLISSQELMPKETQLHIPAVKDDGTYEEEDPECFQISHYFQDPCQDGDERNLSPTQKYSGFSSQKITNSCEELLKSGSTRTEKEPVVEDIPTTTPKSFKNVWRLPSFLQIFVSCFHPCVQE